MRNKPTESSYLNITYGHGSITFKKTLCSINNCHQAKKLRTLNIPLPQIPTPITKSPIHKSTTKPKHAHVKETHLTNTN